MREILFRGKREKTGEWVEGYLVIRDEPFLHDIVVPVGNSSQMTYAVIRETVGQYTGMKDKNGKRIFEGDIVKIDDDWDKYGWAAGEKGVIYFENGQFKLKTKVSIFVMDYAFKEGAVVLCTIHDNPELLEV